MALENLHIAKPVTPTLKPSEFSLMCDFHFRPQSVNFEKYPITDSYKPLISCVFKNYVQLSMWRITQNICKAPLCDFIQTEDFVVFAVVFMIKIYVLLQDFW